MASKVFHISPRSKASLHIMSSLERLLEHSEFSQFLDVWNLVAIKLHFGEEDGWGYIHPKFVRRVINQVKKHGGKPFLTDTSSVYVGSRSDAVSHIQTALTNGFDYIVTGAPVIIADGLKGSSSIEVETGLGHYKKVCIASEIAYSDGMICLSHFKGHELCGFGGAIKNVGMGLAARKGKLSIHSKVTPYIKKECTGCGTCKRYCASGAIYLEGGRAYINAERCTGCGQCIINCPNGCIKIRWDESAKNVQEKICEYAYGIIKSLGIPAFFLNFLIHIAPDCDCCDHTDASICPDLGILASTDVVAVDQASVDLINKSQGIPNTALGGKHGAGTDKFRIIHPEVDWEVQLAYAEKIGLGSRQYDLIPFP
ncbi:DUF362 domain-containing protein [bacterium]|nr:DUF362 domain-containing protein [bacterium]